MKEGNQEEEKKQVVGGGEETFENFEFKKQYSLGKPWTPP